MLRGEAAHRAKLLRVVIAGLGLFNTSWDLKGQGVWLHLPTQIQGRPTTQAPAPHHLTFTTSGQQFLAHHVVVFQHSTQNHCSQFLFKAKPDPVAGKTLQHFWLEGHVGTWLVSEAWVTRAPPIGLQCGKILPDPAFHSRQRPFLDQQWYAFL